MCCSVMVAVFLSHAGAAAVEEQAGGPQPMHSHPHLPPLPGPAGPVVQAWADPQLAVRRIVADRVAERVVLLIL